MERLHPKSEVCRTAKTTKKVSCVRPMTTIGQPSSDRTTTTPRQTEHTSTAGECRIPPPIHQLNVVPPLQTLPSRHQHISPPSSILSPHVTERGSQSCKELRLTLSSWFRSPRRCMG